MPTSIEAVTDDEVTSPNQVELEVESEFEAEFENEGELENEVLFATQMQVNG